MIKLTMEAIELLRYQLKDINDKEYSIYFLSYKLYLYVNTM